MAKIKLRHNSRGLWWVWAFVNTCGGWTEVSVGPAGTAEEAFNYSRHQRLQSTKFFHEER